MITKLEKTRNFVGRSEEQRRSLEEKIKGRYEISDFSNEYGIGYHIQDNHKDKDIYFSPNSRLTLETRYLEKKDSRNVTENALDLFARVAVNIAEADLKYQPEKDIKPVAEEFLESLLYKEFMPNTPTLCNAGRSLQQLAACFVLPVADYMATDDIFDDPEKQGEGIYDSIRQMSMIHKSGGGTGFNFSHLRPRADKISTTFGTSSGPISFIKVFDASTNAVNQGGFRRGANMGILDYTHPDIFEFINEKAGNKSLKNFNLSVAISDEFMDLVNSDGYYKLINPKGEVKNVPIEERIWKRKNIFSKNDPNFKMEFNEKQPSLIIDEDDTSVINSYNNEKVGKIGDDDSVLISAKLLFNYLAESAWKEGCPGVIFKDRLKENNKTPHLGEIEATNPCGEQPLLPYEACNLLGINLSTCIKDNRVDYDEIKRRVYKGVHFQDNVIDMSKFPFQKVYGKVHGTRKIGLGLMGWAEMLTQLSISYDSEKAINLAKDISNFVTNSAREKSQELAEERGVFPYFEGSVFDKLGIKVRNATVTTIAPNGTTGMIADVTGGIEPFFKLAYKKTCMDGKELIYRTPLLIDELQKRVNGGSLDDILKEVDDKGTIKDIEGISEEIKNKFKTSHEISPEWHVKMQAAFQTGKDGVGVDNAVSKTVNLREEVSVEDVINIYKMAHKEKCVGITVFRDNSKIGVYSGLGKEVELVRNNVDTSLMLDIKSNAIKYRIKRKKDSLHITLTSDLYMDDKNKKAYFLPSEVFQSRVPLGHATSVSFAQSGMDRTEILKGPNPDYAEFIQRLQSASSNEEEQIGEKRIKSIEHAVGVAFEDYLLRNGIIKYEDKFLVNNIRKPNLRKVENKSEEFDSIMSQLNFNGTNEKVKVKGNNAILAEQFECLCGSQEYFFEAGCHSPKCKKCGTVQGGDCG